MADAIFHDFRSKRSILSVSVPLGQIFSIYAHGANQSNCVVKKMEIEVLDFSHSSILREVFRKIKNIVFNLLLKKSSKITLIKWKKIGNAKHLNFNESFDIKVDAAMLAAIERKSWKMRSKSLHIHGVHLTILSSFASNCRF